MNGDEVFKLFQKNCDNYKHKNDIDIQKLHDRISDDRKEIEEKMTKEIKTISNKIDINQRNQNKLLLTGACILIGVLFSGFTFFLIFWFNSINQILSKINIIP